MPDDPRTAIRHGYDQIAGEYARRIYDELERKPFDREILSHFAKAVGESGEVCDMGDISTTLAQTCSAWTSPLPW
jgi:hypothetical protein